MWKKENPESPGGFARDIPHTLSNPGLILRHPRCDFASHRSEGSQFFFVSLCRPPLG